MIRRSEVQPWLGLCLLLGVLCTLSPLRTHAAESPRPPEGLAAPDQSASRPRFALLDANGDTVPLLSDSRRQMTRAYSVLRDDPKMLENPQQIGGYLRAQRTWVVTHKEGVMRQVKVTAPRNWQPPNDEILKVLRELK